jgi:hypothetical protein
MNMEAPKAAANLVLPNVPLWTARGQFVVTLARTGNCYKNLSLSCQRAVPVPKIPIIAIGSVGAVGRRPSFIIRMF